MQPWVATLIGAGVVVIIHLITAIFTVGMLSQKVKDTATRVENLERRQGNVETVLSGPGGHGERLTALEAWRIEHRAQVQK